MASSHIALDSRDIEPGPRWDLRQGDIASIGAADDLTLRRIAFDRAIPGRPATPGVPSEVRLLQFTEVPDGTPVFLTDAQIAQLSKEGRFRVEMLDHAERWPRLALPTALGLTDAERSRVDKHMKYVNACRALGDKFAFNHSKIRPLIQAVAEAHGETPPSTSTVFRNIKRFDEAGDRLGSAAIARRRGSGRHGKKFQPNLEKELYDCIVRSLHLPNGTAEDALAFLKDWNDQVNQGSPLKLPSLRTVQRRYNEHFDKYTRDFHRKGEIYAERKHGAYYERSLPTLPLEEVEVDHTPFDIILIDEESDIVFGRPDVVTIRDRCTGICLGFSIGWELPSYASFIEAVRHAMYPKDLSAWPDLQNSYPCWGRWKRMAVDNAMHFLGRDIAHAAQELKFEILELRPGEPWMKGAEERLLGILNRKVAHNLPGATLSNIQERRDHQERLEKPQLTLKQFEAFLVAYIVDEYHHRPHEGLGPLRTLGDVPMRLWQRDIGKVKIRALPDPDTFAALAGDIAERTIQRHGVEWDHIVYQSEALIAIRVHPEHKPGKGSHASTRYRVTRDPQDLGRIWIFDPYRKQRFEVPAVRQDYAAGLPLHQHQVLIARHREMVKGAVDVDGLLRVRATMLRLIEGYRKDPSTKDADRRLARFLGKQKAKRVRSSVEPKNESAAASADLLDLENPIGVVKPELRSARAPNSNRRKSADKSEHVRPMTVEPGELPQEGERPRIEDDQTDLPLKTREADDVPSLDELRSRHSEWEGE